jgi:hypothetical protein
MNRIIAADFEHLELWPVSHQLAKLLVRYGNVTTPLDG